MALAQEENLEVTPVAVVTEAKRLVMHWNGKNIVDLSRAFLDTNGAEKHITAEAAPAKTPEQELPTDFAEGFENLMSDLNVCSKRGLVERFDSTIGAGTVLMPFGGKLQLTPSQAMVHKLPVLEGETDTCSFMAWGGNPFILEQSPYHGAYLAVVESCAKLIATGAEFNDVYLSFQEYFERLGSDPKRWGKPLAALLGAFKAQLGLGVAAIGGKDSMSGSFEDLDVPPTLVSFAVTTGRTVDVLPNVFALPGDQVVLLQPEVDENGLPTTGSLLELFDTVNGMIRSQDAVSVWTPGHGGVAEAVFKMGLGSGMGFNFYQDVDLKTIFGWNYGAFVVELAPGSDAPAGAIPLGVVSGTPDIRRGGELVPDDTFFRYETKLESVYPCNIPQSQPDLEPFTYDGGMKAAPVVKTAKPKVLIPVFPGTNCEYDSARAFPAGRLLRRRRAGRLGQVHHGLLPRRRGEGRGHAAPRRARRPHGRHLQRLPGAHQARPRTLRQDHGHGRALPDADLQHHRPPPVAHRLHARLLRSLPVAAERGARGRLRRADLARRGPLPRRPRADPSARGKRPDRDAVRRLLAAPDGGRPV